MNEENQKGRKEVENKIFTHPGTKDHLCEELEPISVSYPARPGTVACSRVSRRAILEARHVLLVDKEVCPSTETKTLP